MSGEELSQPLAFIAEVRKVLARLVEAKNDVAGVAIGKIDIAVGHPDDGSWLDRHRADRRFTIDKLDDRSILFTIVSEIPTKERILDAAESIMLERSFHSVGLNQILSAVKVPKGSFYHYFDSKEQFGVEMLRHYASEANAYKRRMLLSSDIEDNPIERLFTMFTTTIGKIQENGGKCPCLMQKLAAEVSNFSEPMREELAKGFTEVMSILRQTLDEAVTKGFLAKDFDTQSESEFIMDVWSGSQQRTTIFRNVAPMRRAIEIFRQRLGDSA